jgi:predicted porin
VTWTTSYYFGQEQPDGERPDGPDGFFRVFDTYASYAAAKNVSVGVDLTHLTNQVTTSDSTLSLTGVGAYARYQLGPAKALSLRYEWLDDEGLFGGPAQKLQEVTATAEYRFADGFLMRGEVRSDWSNQRFFTGPAPGDLRASQTTALVGLVWWFGNKSGTW